MGALAWLTAIAAGIGGLVTGSLALGFWRDPEAAMARATHRREKLTQVMAGRYAAFTLLAFGAAGHGDPRVILYLFAVFGLLSLYDAWLYRRDGHPAGPHLLAAAGCGIVMALSLATLATG